jgi:serine/threonine-protein kinase
METENHKGPSADTPIGPGTRLNDIFEIDEKIATGGMGEVFRGHNVTTDEAVAIKIVLGEFARDEKYSNLFFKEARVLSSLNHPSIVRYQIFTIDKVIGRPYLVMEYIHGMSLAERLGTGPLSVAEVRRLTAKLADGLETAHAAGVVHRDLSPDNILLANNDVALPKLIDFGIARTTQAGHKTFLAGEFAGRTNFASPEQFGLFGGNVEAASDVYSLALVVVNALQGAPLDMNGSQYEMIEKRKRVPDLSNLDADLRPVIEEMLVPDPANRRLTMADVANYFSGREPIANLKRSAEVPVDDPDDFWTQPIETAPATTQAERTPPAGDAAIVSGSADEPAPGPMREPERLRPAPAAATIIATASMPPVTVAPTPVQPDASPKEEPQPQFDALPAVDAKPIVWETQPVVTTRPAAALPVRKRGRVWPYALTATVLVLAAGGAGAYYTGALKNIVLPPELDAMLGRKTAATDGQVAQDDLPDLTAQPDRPAKTHDQITEVKPIRTKTRPAITQTVENVPVKKKTNSAVDETTASPDKAKVADKSSVSGARPKTDKTIQVTSLATAADKAKTQAIESKIDNPRTDVETKPKVDVQAKADATAKVEAKPEADDSAKIGATLEADETAKIDLKPKDDGKTEPAVTTSQKTETASDDHKAEATADSRNNDSATDTSTDDASNLGGILPNDNQDKVAQNNLQTDHTDKPSHDASAKPKVDDTVSHKADTAAEMTKPLSSDMSKQDLDQTSGRVENHVVQETPVAKTTPVVQETKKDDKVVEPEIPVTSGKPAEAKKTEETAQVTPVDHTASKVNADEPANTTSQTPIATVDNHGKKNETDETHVTTTETSPVKAGDTTLDTKAADASIGLPSDLLPSEKEVKTTPSNMTANNAGETNHHPVKPSDTATSTDVHPEPDHSADNTEAATKTNETANTEAKPSDTTTIDDRLPANDNSVEKTDDAGNKTDQATDTGTKPSDTTTHTGQLPAANDNHENTAKTDSETEQTEQATDETADTQTKPSDNSADSNEQPAANASNEDTARTDDSAAQAEQDTNKTGQTADTGTKTSDSTVDSGLPADTTTADNNVQPKDETTEGETNNEDSSTAVNAEDSSSKKPAAQSELTDVSVGNPTPEMKHPEIAVDEGLAKRDSWVASFEGGTCFYARMTTNVASAAGIMAVSADSQPFYSLNDTFTSTFGLEPALRGLPIDKRQCAVIDLLKQLRQAPSEALDLQLTPSDQVVGGEPLSSHVEGVTKPFMTVYLVDNDGKVYDLSKDVRKKTGRGIEFDYRTKEATSKVKTFNILLLIGSDKPLAVDFPRKSPLAKNIIPAIAKAINLQPAGVQYAYGFFKVVPKTN